MTADSPDLLVLAPGWQNELFMPLRLERHLGLAYLVAWLRQHGARVDQVVEAEALTVTEAVDRIEQREPRAVGFTVHDTTFHLVRCLARELRRRRPALPIIAGGPTATFSDTLILEAEPAIDFCVRGEGEETTLELLDSLGRGRPPDGISGITWRRRGRLVRTPNRRLLRGPDVDASLDVFPSPYLTAVLPPEEDVGILTSRGCGQHCTYCNFSAMSGGRVSHHSLDRVVSELRLIAARRKPGRGPVSILDDMFTVDRERTRALCRRLIDERIDLQYWCQTRGDALDDETLDLMVRAGVRSMTMGLESAVPSNLRVVGKVQPRGGVAGENPEEAYVNAIRQNAARALERGLRVSVSVITGLPRQTAADANRTVDFVESLGLPLYYHDYLILYPGTPLFARTAEHGLGLSVPATRLPVKTVFTFDVDSVRVLPNAAQQVTIRRAAIERLGALFSGRWSRRTASRGIEGVLAAPGEALGSLAGDAALGDALTMSPLVVTVDGPGGDRRPDLVRLIAAGLPVINLVSLSERAPENSAGDTEARVFDVRLLTEVVERRRLERCQVGAVAFMPLRHASHAGLNEAMPRLEYAGSAVILTCGEHDVHAFNSLLDDPRPVLAARRRLGVDCVLADACRWLDAGCPVAEGRVLTLARGGRNRLPATTCLSRTDIPASRERTWAASAAAAEISRRRGCASCPVQNTCSRCARPEPFTESQFCSIRRSGAAARLIGGMELLDTTCFAARFSAMLA